MSNKVFWQGRTYNSIKEFDCHVVDLETERGGGYLTVIPISPKEYRERHRMTRAAVRIEIGDAYTVFKITDDWGAPYRMAIPNEMKEEIRVAKQAAIKQNLLTQ